MYVLNQKSPFRPPWRKDQYEYPKRTLFGNTIRQSIHFVAGLTGLGLDISPTTSCRICLDRTTYFPKWGGSWTSQKSGTWIRNFAPNPSNDILLPYHCSKLKIKLNPSPKTQSNKINSFILTANHILKTWPYTIRTSTADNWWLN